MASLGFKVDARPADDVMALSRLVEAARFDELWFCEDLGLAGGIAQVAAALAVTNRVEVGLGIAPAAVRNPMYLAMEFASLARLSGNRFHAGIGHGMPRWLRQVGQHPDSLMTCMAEVSEAVHELLAGRRVSVDGRHVHLDGVRLDHPPLVTPPLSLGVRGPRGVELAKTLGLGVILAEGSSPGYVAQVRETLGPELPITVFTWCSLDDDDPSAACDRIWPTVHTALGKPSMAHQLGDRFQNSPPRESISELSVSGDAATCLESIQRLADGGADRVVLQPVRGREEDQIAQFGARVLPHLMARSTTRVAPREARRR
ncbi:LLM class flavin-dependent oxidoreductase [Mycobacterium yunnanensis]|uniref:LLM class flavin-dependent oxidoreductase n=1 Tax=Mycobacterium yunnanensis TaxID=368477 RepID=A0A9X2Z1M7_9MYCO|nr:LLM class flavin-dependent oxidoreductase [Mycobacterium yunnanensis]MCV7421709.1 LLM class flavin-dependent oxidoreductase [Mycobacterium yunnanensis]